MAVHTYGYAEHRRRTIEASGSVANDSRPQKQSKQAGHRQRGAEGTGRTRDQGEALRELEAAIETLEERLERVESDLVEASTAGDRGRIAELGAEHSNLQRALAEKYDAWHDIVECSGTEEGAG